MKPEIRRQVDDDSPAEKRRADFRGLQVGKRREDHVDSPPAFGGLEDLLGRHEPPARNFPLDVGRKPGIRGSHSCARLRGGCRHDLLHLGMLREDPKEDLPRIARGPQHRRLHSRASWKTGDPAAQRPHEPERRHPVARHNKPRVVSGNRTQDLADAKVVQRGGHAACVPGQGPHEAEGG